MRPLNPVSCRVPANLLGLGILKIFGLKFEAEGREHLDGPPRLAISNHQSNLDIVPGGLMIPSRMVSIGKKSLLKLPFFGLYYWLSGNILIDRSNKRKAFASMDLAVQAIKNKNTSIWIMPEGTRSKGKGLLPFKKGAFHTAIKAGCPVVPVCISSFHKNLDLNSWNSGTIKVKVLPPILTEGMTMEDVTELSNNAHALMSQCIESLDQSLL
ncbi:MAG: 1-acyl-sn-glycerol-3-phosphate acyltransferase [Halobacteriovoraceae bacterium]|jgi:1-acyl-sn-glycerol-3-phosphate acyltransferase|nr:1-acyl-sn-glycerol-3-phosphate acyltransferase [Halobacteriovoraceae bacterium]